MLAAQQVGIHQKRPHLTLTLTPTPTLTLTLFIKNAPSPLLFCNPHPNPNHTTHTLINNPILALTLPLLFNKTPPYPCHSPVATPRLSPPFLADHSPRREIGFQNRLGKKLIDRYILNVRVKVRVRVRVECDLQIGPRLKKNHP